MNVRKVLPITGTLLLVLLAVPIYFSLYRAEVDDVAENGPINSEIISSVELIPLFQGVLAASLSWDYDKDRFFISTDQPHSLFAEKIATFYVVNSTFDKILHKVELSTDGDLEGIAYIGDGEVAIISEVGTVYFLKEDSGQWEKTNTVSVFDGECNHKLGSLAYDPANKILYSAEKEGQKIVYRFTRKGKLLDSFEFKVNGVEINREFDLDSDYTIAGMSFANQHLYLFSEAYSTLFKYNPEAKQLAAVYGIKDIHESAGITLKGGAAYLVGDFEGYLPAPNIYRVNLPVERL